MPKLVVISEELAGKTYDLTADVVTLGRGLDNTIRLEDSTISHHHASITMSGPDVILRDLNSTNGTRLNGQRITEAKLTHGDIVRFGRIEMRFEGEIKKASAPLPKPSAGINVEEIGAAGKPSDSFVSTSPFPKQKKQKRSPLQWIIFLLCLVAAVLLGFLLYKYAGG